MTVLTAQKPFTTEDPVLTVENKLAVGRHQFRLVVVNVDGVESDPVDAIVEITDGTTGDPTRDPTGGITVPGRLVNLAEPAVPKPADPVTLDPAVLEAAVVKPAVTPAATPAKTVKPKKPKTTKRDTT